MNKIIAAFVLIIFLCPFAEAATFTAAAIVNGEVISNRILNNRLSLAISSSGLKSSTEIRKKLAPQILQALIDETLQKQEAAKANVLLSETEIQKAVSSIEAQNKISPGGFGNFIRSKGILPETATAQIKAQLLWQKYVLRVIQPKIIVSDSEVAETMERLKNQSVVSKTQVLLSEILLPVSDPKHEADAKSLALQLVEEIRSGTDFSSVANQVSANNSTANDGNIGWVAVNDLDENLQAAVKDLNDGAISSPIRVADGYVILKLHKSRTQTEKPTGITEEKTKDFLVRQKIDLEVRRLMKNLRRDAFIEMRNIDI